MKFILFLTISFYCSASFCGSHHSAESTRPWVWNKMSKTHKDEYHSMSKEEKANFNKMIKTACEKAKSSGKDCDQAALDEANKYFKEKGQKNTQWNRQQVENDLKKFVHTELKKEGAFKVKDHVSNVIRNLSLTKIHSEKILATPDGTHFICADFIDKSGDKVDVDFFVIPGNKGSVGEVKRMKVHKVNGTTRYTYLLKNNVWVEQKL